MTTIAEPVADPVKSPIRVKWAIQIEEGFLMWKHMAFVLKSDGKILTFPDRKGAETLARVYRNKNGKVIPYVVIR